MAKKQPRKQRPATKKRTPQQIYKLLSAPLPDEAIRPIPNSEFSEIIPAYEIERLNEVFGPGEWKTELSDTTCAKIGEEYGKENATVWEATTKLTLTVEAYRIHHEQYGGSMNADKGNALKGAATDAFGKCCSLLGIAKEVYMGLKNNQNMPQVEQYTEANPLGTQHSTKHRFVYHSGVCAQSEYSDPDMWANINGVLCLFPESVAEMVDRFDLDYKQISVHGLWEQPKKGFKYLHVTSVLQVRSFEPIKIPEMKP